MFCITLLCDLKAAQMNMQHSLIQKLMLNEFELGHYAFEAIKNICYVIDECAIDLSKQIFHENFPQVARTSMIRQG